MTVNLSPTWRLSTDNAAPSSGRPVLVNRTTGEAFRPGDIVRRPYPSCGFMPVGEVVRHLAKKAKLDDEGRDLVGRFIKGTKGDERQ